jgi:hypothetical protein
MGTRNGAGKEGKSAKNRKKMSFRGNELKDLLQTQGLDVFRAKNELKTNSIFGAKKAK